MGDGAAERAQADDDDAAAAACTLLLPGALPAWLLAELADGFVDRVVAEIAPALGLARRAPLRRHQLLLGDTSAASYATRTASALLLTPSFSYRLFT